VYINDGIPGTAERGRPINRPKNKIREELFGVVVVGIIWRRPAKTDRNANPGKGQDDISN